MLKLLNLLFCALLTVCSTMAMAQNKPTVEIVVGATPGGPQDIAARQLHKALSAVDATREYVVIHRPGAAGSIAYAYVTKPQTNNTIMIVSVGQFSELILTKDFSEITKDMQLIGPIWSSPGVMAVGAKSGINSVADLIRKGQTGKLTCGAASRSIKLNLDYLAQEMKFINTEVVMFKGTTDGLPLLVKGDLDCWLDALIGPVHTFSQSGQIRLIATSENRVHPQVPNLPLMRTSLPAGTLFHYSWWAGVGIAEVNSREFREAIVPIIAQAVKRLESTDSLTVLPLAKDPGFIFAATATQAVKLNQALTKK